ncbi:DUF1080 domain-containing protein [Flavobacterium sp. ASW18X]|uniref:3-keto-disaccharide hydrolase n=1 Tax=Flavobacterium sp. ASW18X TaxID=2572595 RepID=UPI0010AE1204|nr:DUF1080 domain-containing protein [Flavobacterium sp. ASW18X]TKD66073.1 DUF1080 domain-containing protein [Flavobacterium sp. ASW18X]
MKKQLICLSFLLCNLLINAQKSDLEGRWDLEIDFQGKKAPSWLEIRHSGHATHVGRFVFAFGSARPVAEITIKENNFSFIIPRQWEPEGEDMKLVGRLNNNTLTGTITYTDGSSIPFTGTRAPKQPHKALYVEEKPIALLNGKNLEGWHADREENQWQVNDGILVNPKSGANLISDQKFRDFKAEIEFKYPKGSNSGIYLRGRYEVQIEDNYGYTPMDIYFGGIYGFLEPNENAALPAGEWQKYEITLIGNRVTIVANGKRIITDQTIPGITGGALDSKEGEPGAFMIQGDHGPVEFRKFLVTPLN